MISTYGVVILTLIGLEEGSLLEFVLQQLPLALGAFKVGLPICRPPR